MQARVRCRWRRKQRKHRSIREARCFHYSATSDTPSPTHLALWQIFHALCVLALTRFLSPSVRWNISLSAGLRNSPFEKLPCETGSTYVYDIWYYTMMYIYVIYNYIIYNFLFNYMYFDWTKRSKITQWQRLTETRNKIRSNKKFQNCII